MAPSTSSWSTVVGNRVELRRAPAGPSVRSPSAPPTVVPRCDRPEDHRCPDNLGRITTSSQVLVRQPHRGAGPVLREGEHRALLQQGGQVGHHGSRHRERHGRARRRSRLASRAGAYTLQGRSGVHHQHQGRRLDAARQHPGGRLRQQLHRLRLRLQLQRLHGRPPEGDRWPRASTSSTSTRCCTRCHRIRGHATTAWCRCSRPTTTTRRSPSAIRFRRSTWRFAS